MDSQGPAGRPPGRGARPRAGSRRRPVGVERSTLRSRLDAFRGSPFDLVPIAHGVSREAALLIGEESERLPGVVVEVEPIRQYLDETGAAGGPAALARASATPAPSAGTSYERLEAEGYLRDDVIGKCRGRGLLRGRAARLVRPRLVERDASGRLLEVIETIREPVAGTNLMLTIDAEMQRLATQALTWGMEVADVSQGVTVVMNPQTGEILAMVSLPAYDNNKFAGGISAEDFSVYLTDANKPLRNHAISDIYPPGSTYKLVTAIAAMEEGVTTAGPDLADLRLLPDPRRPGRRVPVRLESPGLRSAGHGRRLRQELGHVLLPDGRRDRHRPARRVGPRAGLRRAVRHPAARRGARDHRQHRVGARSRGARECSPASWRRPASGRT